MAPDTALPAYATAPILIRRPAHADYLARKVLSIAWAGNVPPTGSQVWLLQACRAELDWSVADYCRITGTSPLANDPQYDGPHPAQRYRLLVEQLAAKVLNARNHAHFGAADIRQSIKVLRKAVRAASDAEQGALYRDSWAGVAARTLGDFRVLIERRRKVWPVFVQAAREYRAERQAVDVEQIAKAA